MAQEKFDTDCLLICIKKYLLTILGAVVVLQGFSVFRSCSVLEVCTEARLFRHSPVWLCDTVACSTSGFPVLHCFLEFAQTRVHWVGWCHPATSSSAAASSFCLQSFPISGSFPISQLFTSGGQSTGASALVLPLLKMLYLQTESHSEVLKVRASTFTYWKRQPTPVFLPGKSHGWRSLIGYSVWGRKELDHEESWVLKKWCF